MLVTAPLVPHVRDSLRVGGFADPHLESSQAADTLARDLGYSTSSVIVTFQSHDPHFNATDPRFIAETNAALANLAGLSVRTSVLSHADNRRQISPDELTAFEVVELDTD